MGADTDESVTPLRRSGGVVARFQELIARGELAAGDRLPSERALAEQFGVGRNSIREALRELEVLGLVEARRGDGTYLRAPDAGHLMAPFRSVISLSTAAASEVLEFRRVFEPEIAALAARNIDAGGRELLGRSIRRYDDALGAPAPAREADVDFHTAIARCTRNPLVIAVQEALAQLLVDFRSKLVDSSYEMGQQVARGHQAIFGAVMAGDEDNARAAMLAHLDGVEGALADGDPALR